MIEIPERVKDALRDGRLLKNYRFYVLNTDGTLDFVIDNTCLVSETVKYDERMCSGTELKFGLCEGSSLEFQYFNQANINGRQLQTFVDVQYKPDDTAQEVATLTETKTTYIVPQSGDYTLVIPANTSFTLTTIHDGETTTEEFFPTGSEERVTLSGYKVGDVIKTTTEYVGYSFSISLEWLSDGWYTIPMGFFTVSQCPMQFSTGIRKAVCYNKLKSEYLDQKANDMIIEIVNGGEPGISNGVTYYYLLYKLLAGYAIDDRVDTIIPYNVTGEDKTFVNWWDGNTDIAEEYAAFRVYYVDTDLERTRTEGFYVFKRRTATINTRPQSQAHSSACSVMLPKEYNRTTFNPEIAPALRNGFNTIFGRYQDTDVRTYYIQPVYYGDIDHDGLDWSNIDSYSWTYKGTAYKLNEVLDSKTELWPKTFDTPYVFYDTHIDSSIKGMIVIDYDNNGAASSLYPNMQIKSSTPSTGTYDYIFKEFITPENLSSTDYFWLEHDTDIYKTSACNCSTLILPTEMYKCEREETEWSVGYEYPWNDDGYPYDLEFNHKTVSEMEKERMLPSTAESLPDVTLRELQSAVFETECFFGQLDRVTDLFYGVALNTEALYPRDTLYPANDLYPSGGMDRTVKSGYSKLWTDTVGSQTFRYLIITYKGLDENQQEKEFTLQRTINADGTTDYYMSDNWLFKNLVWTANQVGEYADIMVGKMRGIKWFPFELWGAGLPYLETGDEIEIVTKDGSYTSYVLQRQLSGIQNLQDTFINGELDIF